MMQPGSLIIVEHLQDQQESSAGCHFMGDDDVRHAFTWVQLLQVVLHILCMVTALSLLLFINCNYMIYGKKKKKLSAFVNNMEDEG